METLRNDWQSVNLILKFKNTDESKFLLRKYVLDFLAFFTCDTYVSFQRIFTERNFYRNKKNMRDIDYFNYIN